MEITRAAPEREGERSEEPERWEPVCHLAELPLERGAAALVAGRQVALFRLDDGAVVAVCQRDPYSGAYVVARGIVGSRAGRPTVASPMYKHVFDLRTGECVETHGGEARPLRTYATRVIDGVVHIARAVTA
ncbi:nitrite reductase small subunit NirD [Microcella alkalica]|uniref:NAD(P)H-dependent nitrite reductase small subunit n=1 Tax=Microcella alkalica TaxID=355930 RepID=A0A839E7I8_9MICO|nr:nitrite reductase small subunit NirD [Microcella alkalica]MBA8847123.1 NAD(P)H-dependent nitrite reductase small subunit [Microcella alkalica]